MHEMHEMLLCLWYLLAQIDITMLSDPDRIRQSKGSRRIVGKPRCLL